MPMIRTLVAMALLSLAGTAGAGSLAEGQRDYRQFCATCHGDHGRGRMAQVPDFTLGEGLMQGDRQLRERIEAGKGLCPAYRALLSEERINHVVRYLRTLR